MSKYKVSPKTIISHSFVMREMKEYFLEKCNKISDHIKWQNTNLENKTLDELANHLGNTATGKILLHSFKNYSQESLEKVMQTYCAEAAMTISKTQVAENLLNTLPPTEKSKSVFADYMKDELEKIAKDITLAKEYKQLIEIVNNPQLEGILKNVESLDDLDYVGIKNLQGAFGKIDKVASAMMFASDDNINDDAYETYDFYQESLVFKIWRKVSVYYEKTRSEALEPLVAECNKLLTEKVKPLIVNEIKYSDEYFVFYHAQQGNIAFLNDVVTAFSTCLSIKPQNELVYLREHVSNQPNYMTNFEDYLKLFYQVPFANDHSQFARNTMVSLNLSFLSNHDLIGESTLQFFLANMNASDQSKSNLMNFLSKFLGDMQGDHAAGRVQEYLKLSSEIEELCGSRILQIFIKKDEANSLVYPSRTFGHPLRKDGIIPEISKFLLAPDIGLFDSSIKNIQGRLITNMDKLTDPTIVKVKGVRSKNPPLEKIKSCYKKLSELVLEDITYYLANLPENDIEQSVIKCLNDIIQPRYIADEESATNILEIHSIGESEYSS
jgi:hypothetical protein